MFKTARFFQVLFLSSCFIPISNVLATDVDALFKNLDLERLFGKNDVLNLIAQSKDGALDGTSNIADFDDFFAINNVDNQSKFVEFDGFQTILETKEQGSTWVGVASFTPSELNNLVSFQEGLELLKKCMPTPLTNVTRLTVYKTLNTQQVIYDYAFKTPDSDYCEEWLYSPADNKCQPGLGVACHLDINMNVKKLK